MIVITEKLKLLVKKNPSSCERLNECIDILKNRLELFEPEGKKFLRSALLSETIKQESLVLGFGNPYLRDDYALKLSSVLEDLHKCQWQIEIPIFRQLKTWGQVLFLAFSRQN